MRYTVLSHKAITAWAVLIVLVGVGVAVWLLLAYTGGDANANSVQLEAIRTAGTVVVGTGGAAALLLAARRQRTAEIALKQKDRDQADAARAHAHQVQVAKLTRQHRERVAAATEVDAEARRITDLYTKAADQLGSDKAPVRLAGFYALERLAQDHRDQRQTIVNVWCAYLRMPHILPIYYEHNALVREFEKHLEEQRDNQLFDRAGMQEREVRRTIQRLLAKHLRPGPDSTRPAATFWPDINLDLTSATLIDFDFQQCNVHDATFRWASFVGDAHFAAATFTGVANSGMPASLRSPTSGLSTSATRYLMVPPSH